MSETLAASAERWAFTARLQWALKQADCPAHAQEIAVRCNLLMPGSAVTKHAVGKWLRAEALPTQIRLRALSAALGVTPEWLRFGPRTGAVTPVVPLPSPLHSIAVDLAAMSEGELNLVKELVELLLLKQGRERHA